MYQVQVYEVLLAMASRESLRKIVCDAILRIVTTDLHSYWRFQADHLTRIPSVLNVKTDVPMETLKRSFELPLAS